MIYIITASRRIPQGNGPRLMEEKVIELVNDPQTEAIIFGGARGGDTIMLNHCLQHRKGPSPKLVVVLPVDLQFQPQETWAITKKTDLIIEMKQKPFDEQGKFRKEIYKERNRHMIELALSYSKKIEVTNFNPHVIELSRTDQDTKKVQVIAFWNMVKMYSGTYSTINMARTKYGLDVEIIPLTNNT